MASILGYATHSRVVRNLALVVDAKVDGFAGLRPAISQLVCIDRVFIDWLPVDRERERAAAFRTFEAATEQQTRPGRDAEREGEDERGGESLHGESRHKRGHRDALAVCKEEQDGQGASGAGIHATGLYAVCFPSFLCSVCQTLRPGLAGGEAD